MVCVSFFCILCREHPKVQPTVVLLVGTKLTEPSTLFYGRICYFRATSYWGIVQLPLMVDDVDKLVSRQASRYEGWGTVSGLKLG